jgi:hypothetical protein
LTYTRHCPKCFQGGFGTVSEVRAFNATMTEESESMDQDYVVAVSKQQNRNSSSFRSLYDDTETDLGELESRKFIADHCLRTVGGDARYAIKVLSPSTKQNPAMFLQGVIGMFFYVNAPKGCLGFWPNRSFHHSLTLALPRHGCRSSRTLESRTP